ncbi:hypothetical protein KEM09_15885 [Carboxylicivirga mesophila]|uniref:Isomerase n=1 Tax=Carboxylicivirga mesophila TaxID=1166478 RepID=A0ABS5KD96_9BACT|nr:trehalase family glycosidase [Carboxylicivirga mesophila]MBS2212899.1 hypothetical protein [Carboxylicivirga mesophila]
MKKLLSVFVLALILVACQKHQPKQVVIDRSNYPNVLNLAGSIKLPQEDNVASFSDKGTWHSFSLIEDDNLEKVGSFVGPYLMRQQRSFWLSPSLIGLQIKDVQADKFIDLSASKKVQNTFYPGILQQSFSIGELEISLSLLNTNERTTIVTADIINNGETKELQFGWKGEVFAVMNNGMSQHDNRVLINIQDEENAQLIFKDSNITLTDSCYSYLEAAVSMKPKQKATVTTAFTYTFNQEELDQYAAEALKTIDNVNPAIEQNEQRWNAYLKTLLKGSDKALLDVNKYDKLAVKSLLTLMHNWRSAAGDIYHQGIVPSYAASYFQGLWAWDSWKHAVAIAPFEGELAKDQIRAMYDYQNEEGMIADCFFRDLDIEGVNWRNTKAPLSAWCIYEVYEQTQDLEFLKELYPKLLKYHEWWYINRDHDQNGLCEYGSTDGTRIAAAWESGMDNAVRFDDAIIMENKPGAFSLNQESVDLNAYLAQEKRYIQQIAGILKDDETAEKYAREAEQLNNQIQEVMYCSEDGFYYDVEMKSQEKIRIQGPEGWAPLYNKVATSEQAQQIKEVIMDKERFNTPMPFPTLSAAHEKFNPEKGYWRGPVWLDQAYFAIVGLNNYGFEAEARQMAQKMVESAKGLAFTQEPIRENYHPITKEGLNAEHFSWSAAHILMLF